MDFGRRDGGVSIFPLALVEKDLGRNRSSWQRSWLCIIARGGGSPNFRITGLIAEVGPYPKTL